MTGETAADLHEPDLPTTIPGLLERAVERFGDVAALLEGEVRLDYRELDQQVTRAAAGLLAVGIEPGDRVAVWAPNIHEWVIAALAASTVGAVLVPINTRYRGEEAAWLLEASRARLLWTVTGFLDTDYVAELRSARGDGTEARPIAGLPHLERVVVLRGDAPPGTCGWDAFLGGGAGVAAAEVRDRAAAVGSDDLSDLIFTSGTTGRPKGVMATHGQTVRAFAQWSRLLGLEAGERYLVVNPFFHTFGYKAGIVASVLRGATILPHAVFDAEAVLERVAEERVAVLPGPPTLFQSLLDHPRRHAYDVSSLRRTVTGAASIPVSLIQRMRDELGFEVVLTAYGLTEATGLVTMCRAGDDVRTIATTSGRAIPDVEVRTVDDTGTPVPTGTPGEVVVRGYTVMQAYFEDPARTAETIDGDGWLHTGDVGVLDDQGYLDITDRKKDVFIVGGFNAYPAEIESQLVEHPGVAQAAVVGVPDRRLGEVGWAYVVPTSGARLDPEVLVGWARERMANFKAPRRVEVVDALPVNASGKVLKHELRARAARAAERAPA